MLRLLNQSMDMKAQNTAPVAVLSKAAFEEDETVHLIVMCNN